MILIVDCGSQKVPYIEEQVDQLCDFKTVSLFDSTKENLAEYVGVVISGAPILITEVDTQPYLNALSWVKDSPIPVLGICFGHQMLGMLHGALPSRQREDRDWQVIESLLESPLFDKLPAEFEMMQDHCECISIPPGFDLIASSDACINEAMQHKNKALYGVQFHPEVSGNTGHILMENFVNICLNRSAGTQN